MSYSRDTETKRNTMEITLPEMLRTAVEKFMMDATESLDSLEALKITNLTIGLVDMAYSMGHNDGQQADSDHKRVA
jgi:hypothetical protein